jgi:hypothetical protein
MMVKVVLGDKELKATSTNISEGGIALLMHDALPKGATPHLKFTLPDINLSMDVETVIAHVAMPEIARGNSGHIRRFVIEAKHALERFGRKSSLRFSAGDLFFRPRGLRLASNVGLGLWRPRDPTLQVTGGLHWIDSVLEVPVLSYLQLNMGAWRSIRHRLDDERMSITHKFNVGGHEGYITVGLYQDGSPGELFITMAKEGSTVSGLMDSFACAVSLALQHGVPLKLLCEKFAHTRFEPSGWTNNTDIGFAKSIMDYIFRWLQLRFLTGQQQLLFENLRPKLAASSGRLPEAGDLNGSVGSAPLPTTDDRRPTTAPIHAADALASLIEMGDAPTCHVCGSIMVRNGSCYKCMSCGSTSGCS